MKLETWLSGSNKTIAQFRKELGVSSIATTYRYLRGERIPRPEIMRRISEITNGQVTPDDFYDSNLGAQAEADQRKA